jgi:hypothetical protein
MPFAKGHTVRHAMGAAHDDVLTGPVRELGFIPKGHATKTACDGAWVDNDSPPRNRSFGSSVILT